MKFDKLHDLIPYAMGGKEKVLTMHPYNAICLALPGRHAKDTTPKGGDFVVMVDDETKEWVRHPFTHSDLFSDLETKRDAFPELAGTFMVDYLAVVTGADPDKMDWSDSELPGLHPQTMLYALQCLAVAEHRRYSHYESRWGGRYLPFRASAGIVEGLWSASEAGDKTRKRGRIGIEWLEKDYGVPLLTKELFDGK